MKVRFSIAIKSYPKFVLFLAYISLFLSLSPVRKNHNLCFAYENQEGLMIEATLAVSIAVNYDDRFSGRPLARIGGREIRPSRTLLRRGLGEIIDHVLVFHTTAVVVMATPWAGWAYTVQLGFRRGEEHNERNVLPLDPRCAHGYTLAHIFALRRNSRYAIQITRGVRLRSKVYQDDMEIHVWSWLNEKHAIIISVICTHIGPVLRKKFFAREHQLICFHIKICVLKHEIEFIMIKF